SLALASVGSRISIAHDMGCLKMVAVRRGAILTLRADPLETALGGSPPRREHYVAHDVILKMEVVDFDPNLAIISIM
ncbi:hypothetical protein, partial [Burkholderia cenocepacia]